MYLYHLWFRICCGLNVSRYKGALSQFSTTAATTFGPIGIDIQLRFAIWPQPLAKLSGGIMLRKILGTLCTKRWHRHWKNKCLHNKASVQRASWMISNIEVVTIIVLSQVDYRERFPNAFSGEFGDKFVARLSDLPNSVTNLMMNLVNYQID